VSVLERAIRTRKRGPVERRGTPDGFLRTSTGAGVNPSGEGRSLEKSSPVQNISCLLGKRKPGKRRRRDPRERKEKKKKKKKKKRKTQGTIMSRKDMDDL